MSAHKVMLLGDIGVGKSSLARRLVFDKFEFDYKPTIGVDIYRYEVPSDEGRAATTLIIWDTDGNFSEAIFRHVYMREAAAALIVGDMSRIQTLDSMAKLADGFRDAFPGRHLTLIVNKTDLIADADQTPLPSALSRAHAPLIRTSAKTGCNVVRAFTETADTILRRGY